MTATTTIMLSADGINALFPEGTEARVTLQTAVLKTLATQYVKNINLEGQLKKELDRAVTTARDQVMKELGLAKAGHYGSVTLNAEARGAIQLAIQSETNTLISSLVKAKVSEDEVKSAVILALNQNVRPMVQKAIADTLTGLAALQAASKGLG